MKLRLGYIVFYSNRVKEGSAGEASGPIIKIRPEYKDDKGLLEHEIYHVKNFRLNSLVVGALLGALAAIGHYFYPSPYVFTPVGLCFIADWLLYKNDNYRLWEEVEAYKVQLDYAEDKDQSRRQFAVRLATKYDLKIEIIEAFRLLGG